MIDKTYAAFLFDMDGTVINSIAVAERIWGDWAGQQGLDVEAFLPTIHGVRGIETIRRLAIAGMDPEAESERITQIEMLALDGILPIAGAAAFLSSLPPHRWALATSAPRELALRRMAIAGLPVPTVVVTAEDVAFGKPAPDCFKLAAARLGYDARDCLVFEDAPAGIQAAEAAGADVIVVGATHRHPMDVVHPVFHSYDEFEARADDRGLVLRRRTPTQEPLRANAPSW